MYTQLSFQTGNRVREDGWYICVPCGYKKYLKRGDRFPKCLGCMGRGRKRFQKGIELWERMTNETFTKNGVNQ